METACKTQRKRKLDLLSAVENIVELAKDSQLSPEFYCKAARFIKHLSDKLSLTKEQSVMMALFLDQSDDSRIEASDIAKYTGCRTTRMIRYMNDIDELVRRGLIVRSRSSSSVSYRVPIDVVEAFKVKDKMGNSIQNNILQEVETLDGILIATTDLEQNMDNAFEWRFLYKIRFDKPIVEARTAIWHEMLPDLSNAGATLLAERYDFSCGQKNTVICLFKLPFSV